jgi:hypothetical protein
MRQIQNKKLDVVEWLHSQQHQPGQTFNDWIIHNIYPYIKEVLEIVYSEDLLQGCKELFKKIISETSLVDLPIRAFENKANNFYVYQKKTISVDLPEPQYYWKRMTNEDFDRILAKIEHQFLVNFRIHWYEVNKEYMEQESYKDMYVKNHAKILGGDRMSDNTRHHQIRQYLFDILKQSIKAFIEI